MQQKKINISVRDLVDFSVGGKSIEKVNISILSEAAWEGTACHTRFQKEMANQHKENFEKEVILSDIIENEDVRLTVSGRVDGIVKDDESIWIYEIKTLQKEMEHVEGDNESHWGQAQCYAYIYATKNQKKSIGIKLVYIHRESKEQKIFSQQYEINELKKAYEKFVFKYLNWMTKIRKWEIFRNNSIQTLTFPFQSYRRGQKELAKKVYLSIQHENKLFVQAPTGIGKTVGTLFPAVKAMGEGLIDKIFYLTAKTVTAGAAIDTYHRMSENGLNLRTLVITAKDKVCPHETRNCDPSVCGQAFGYYERSKDAMADLMTHQFLSREVIAEYAQKYDVCPFELALDAALYCDLIICDYNYLFDPRIKLQRFFQEVKENYCFLIDEAHNLVDRGRQMYSAEICQQEVMTLRKHTPIEWTDLRRRLGKIHKAMNEQKEEVFSGLEDGQVSRIQLPQDMVDQLRKCAFIMDKYMEDEKEEEYNELFNQVFFKMLYFGKVSEFYDERYATFYMLESDALTIKLMCLDPSELLSKAMDLGRSSILFSATLEPLPYYRTILGAREEDESISLPSPFPQENLKVIVEGRISTKYRDREMTYEDVVQLIQEVTQTKTGNYMIYFPSYAYMKNIIELFEPMTTAEIFIQTPSMSESDREQFLARFHSYGNNTLIAFAVMGGIFGEGIDLVGDRLNGVIIVGTGLPAIGPERELIKEYYNQNEYNGFDYAYTYPGMNRVLQAAGRVIRSETDIGYVVLVDARFAGYRYKRLFPSWWRPEYFTYHDKKVARSVSMFLGNMI